jgi:hypothetical protein
MNNKTILKNGKKKEKKKTPTGVGENAGENECSYTAVGNSS